MLYRHVLVICIHERSHQRQHTTQPTTSPTTVVATSLHIYAFCKRILYTYMQVLVCSNRVIFPPAVSKIDRTSQWWWGIHSLVIHWTPKRLSARCDVSNVLCAAMPHLRMHINRACDHRVVLHATARTTYPSADHSSCRPALRAVHGLLLVDPSKQCGYRRAGWPNRPSGR